jgi:hypothetical protein
MLCRALPLVCGCLLAFAPAASAQARALSPGTRVRVADPGTPRFVGTISGWRGDTLLVATGSGGRARVHAVSLSTVRSIQVSRGRMPRHVSTLQGAAAGFVTGSIGGVGGLLIPTLMDDCNPRNSEELLCFTPTEAVAIGLLLGACYGIPLGAVTGFLLPPERWNSVVVASPPTLALDARGGRVQLGLSFRVP